MNSFSFFVVFTLSTFSFCSASKYPIWPDSLVLSKSSGVWDPNCLGSVSGAGLVSTNGRVASSAGGVIPVVGGPAMSRVASASIARAAAVGVAAASRDGSSLQPHKVVVHEQSKPLDVVAKGTNVEVNHPEMTVSAKPVVIVRKPDVVVSPIVVQKQLPPVKISQLYVKHVQPYQNIIVQKAYANDIKESAWLRAGSQVYNGAPVIVGGTAGSGIVGSSALLSGGIGSAGWGAPYGSGSIISKSTSDCNTL